MEKTQQSPVELFPCRQMLLFSYKTSAASLKQELIELPSFTLLCFL